MPREATGELRHLADGFAARITIQGRERQDFVLPTCATEPEALARCKALAGIAARLRRAGQTGDIVMLLELGAKARAGKPWEAVEAAVDALVGGRVRAKDPKATATPRMVINRWTKGELAKEYPGHIKRKRSARRDVQLSKHIPDEYLDMPLRMWTSETYHAVMRQLPEKMPSGSRRHVAQLMHRTFAMAVEPLNLITVSPIPRMPRIERTRLPVTLLPRHPLAIAQAVGKVDLGYRYLWNFMPESGWRLSQCTGKIEDEGPDGECNDVPPLYWQNIDWEREIAFLQVTKTTPAIEVVLDPSTLAGLAAWRKRTPCPADSDQVFVTTDGTPIPHEKAAESFREHLNLAGVTRETDRMLFPEGKEREHRLQTRDHDLRALFVTASLAQGRSDQWVMSRTLHKTRGQLNTYNRTDVAHFAKHGPIVPSVEAIPELAAVVDYPTDCPTKASAGEKSEPTKRQKVVDNQARGPSGTRTRKPFRAADFKADKPEPAPRESSDINAIEGVGEADSARDEGAVGQSRGNPDAVEMALAEALAKATAAAQWTLVGQLARELEARRTARTQTNVVNFRGFERRGST